MDADVSGLKTLTLKTNAPGSKNATNKVFCCARKMLRKIGPLMNNISLTKRLLTVGLLGLSLAALKLSCLAAPKSVPQAQLAPAPDPISQMLPFQTGNRILFQGDSITDGNRGRSEDPNHILGHGYAFIIAAKYGDTLADRNLTFINRGVSGNKVSDLAARWQNDTLNLKPDILSILIGVNDTSANVSPEQYESSYDKLLLDTITALPDVRLVLCQPFTLPGAKHAGDWDTWRANIQAKQDAVARLATKYGAALVSPQKGFDEAVKRAPAEHWIWDTIHPTYSGHQVLADEWVKTVSNFKFGPRPAAALAAVAANPAPAAAANPVPLTNVAPLNPPVTGTRLAGSPQGALTFGSAQTSNNKKSIVLGWKFTTGAKAIDVSALGYVNDGATATHTVGIYDATSKALVTPALQVTTEGGALSGNNVSFTYVKLPQAVRLAPGTTYLVVATNKGIGWLEKIKDFKVDYGIDPTSLHCAFKFGVDELTFPDATYAANDPVLFGPNFVGTVVP